MTFFAQMNDDAAEHGRIQALFQPHVLPGQAVQFLLEARFLGRVQGNHGEDFSRQKTLVLLVEPLDVFAKCQAGARSASCP